MPGMMRLGDQEDQWSDFYKELSAWHGKKGLWNASLGDQAMSTKLWNQAHGGYQFSGFADPDTPVMNPYTPDQYGPTKQAWHPSGTASEVVAGATARQENRQMMGQQHRQDVMDANTDPRIARAQQAFGALPHDPGARSQEASQLVHDVARIQNPFQQFAQSPEHAQLIDQYTNLGAQRADAQRRRQPQQQVAYDYMNPYPDEVA